MHDNGVALRLKRTLSCSCTHTSRRGVPRQAPARMTAASGALEKHRILCLHGYLQNAEVFSAKIGSMRKGLKSRADFHFVDASHLVAGSETDVVASGGTQEGSRAWWTWQDTEPGMRPSIAARYSGWEASADLLLSRLEELQPIDGVLGFSQGATAGALLLAHLAEHRPALLPKFAILIAGFLPRDSTYSSKLQETKSSVPVLLVHGEADELVPIGRSIDLQRALEHEHGPVSRWDHPGKHMVPSCSGEFKQCLVRFLDSHRPGN